MQVQTFSSFASEREMQRSKGVPFLQAWRVGKCRLPRHVFSRWWLRLVHPAEKAQNDQKEKAANVLANLVANVPAPRPRDLATRWRGAERQLARRSR